MKKIINIISIVLTLAVFPISSHAFTFYLDQVNTNNTGSNGPWASVTLTDTTVNGNDAVHFLIDPIESAFVNKGTNFGLQSFYFNENTTFGKLLKIGNFNPSGWSYKYNEIPKYNAGGDFGKFEFLTGGKGNNRANPLSFDIYTNENRSLSVADFSSILSTEGYLFSAHIADYNGGNSAKFATDGTIPVPEPGTMVLLGFGMLGLAIYGKRRMNKES